MQSMLRTVCQVARVHRNQFIHRCISRASSSSSDTLYTQVESSDESSSREEIETPYQLNSRSNQRTFDSQKNHRENTGRLHSERDSFNRRFNNRFQSYDSDFPRKHSQRYGSDRNDHNQSGRLNPDNQFRNDFYDRDDRQDFYSRQSRQQKVDFTNLPRFGKNFYEEHPDVTSRSKEDVEEFMSQSKIKIKAPKDIAVPGPVLALNEMSFPGSIRTTMNYEGMTSPTMIQSVGWPLALSGMDMVGIAQTGSGKTLSYTLPALIHVSNQPRVNRGEGPVCLILVPTRELAQQVGEVVRLYGRAARVSSTLVYGGTSKRPQMIRLGNGPQICIATPGRLNDFLDSDMTSMERCTYLVLDEADRMLDMGFEPQIRKIINQIRPDRQTLMWSATWPEDVQELAGDFMTNFVQINVGNTELHANPNIKQIVHVCTEATRWETFCNIWNEEILAEDNERPKTLIFTDTKIAADKLWKNMRRAGLSAVVTHGDKSQMQRDHALKDFRSGRAQVLIATDVAARGLDVNDIKAVINYNIPKNIEDYIHRIGRTARGSNTGTAHTIMTEEDAPKARDLVKVIKHAGQAPSQQLLDLIPLGGKYSNKKNMRYGRRDNYYGQGYRSGNRQSSWGQNQYGRNYDQQYNRRAPYKSLDYDEDDDM